MAISESLGQKKEAQLPQGTIEYRERGTGAPIVFVHGALVNADLWRKVVPALAKDYRCIAPDLPLGHFFHKALKVTFIEVGARPFYSVSNVIADPIPSSCLDVPMHRVMLGVPFSLQSPIPSPEKSPETHN